MRSLIAFILGALLTFPLCSLAKGPDLDDVVEAVVSLMRRVHRLEESVEELEAKDRVLSKRLNMLEKNVAEAE